MRESAFFFAARGGRLGEMMELVHNPAMDLRYQHGLYDENALHWASKNGKASAVALLLTNDEFDVNEIFDKGRGALWFACEKCRASCVRQLLQDSRWEHNGEGDNWSFASAMLKGFGPVVLEWVASGKTIDLEGVQRDLSSEGGPSHDMTSFIKSFALNPSGMRHAVRLNIGWYDDLAAEVFARVVFLSDGLLQLKKATEARPLTIRFFRIAGQLPLELQMLCYRVAGIGKMAIPTQTSEIAFKNLALIFIFHAGSRD